MAMQLVTYEITQVCTMNLLDLLELVRGLDDLFWKCKKARPMYCAIVIISYLCKLFLYSAISAGVLPLSWSEFGDNVTVCWVWQILVGSINLIGSSIFSASMDCILQKQFVNNWSHTYSCNKQTLVLTSTMQQCSLRPSFPDDRCHDRK